MRFVKEVTFSIISLILLITLVSSLEVADFDEALNVTKSGNWSHIALNDSDIICFWNFEPDLVDTVLTNHYDLSYRNKDGLGTGGAYVNASNCFNDKCAHFDGIDENINVGNVITSNNTYTISLWVTSRGDTSSGDNFASIIDQETSSADRAVSLIQAYDTNGLYFQFSSPNGSNDCSAIKSTYSLTVDIWYHYALLYNESGCYLFGNSVLLASDTTVNEGPNGLTADMVFGSNTAGLREFNGSIDEVIVFNRSLTEAEIIDLYNNQTKYFKPAAELVLNNGSNFNFAAGYTQANFSFGANNINAGTNMTFIFSYYNVSWFPSSVTIVNDTDYYTFTFPETTTNLSLNITFNTEDERDTPFLNHTITFNVSTDSSSYFVSSSGDGTNPHSWDGAWPNLSVVQWGDGFGEVGAGDILYIDEGRYQEPLIVGANGSGFTRIDNSTYLNLSTMTNDELAADGWVVITANASDGTLDSDVLITGSELFGKTTNGAVNTGFIHNATFSEIYQATGTMAADDTRTLASCNVTNMSLQNACRYLAKMNDTVQQANDTDGSYYFDNSTKILYVNPFGTNVNITNGTVDYELVKTSRYYMDLDDKTGVVIDGGEGKFLQFRFGSTVVANGVIKTNNMDGDIIFRNHRQFYSDNRGHIAHILTTRLIFYNMVAGKAAGNQAYSHSLIDAADIYGFVFNSTIWDGWESHGNTDDRNPIQEYIVKGNTFKHELHGGNTDTGDLKFLSYYLGDDGYIIIENNIWYGLEDYFQGAGASSAAIGILPQNMGPNLGGKIYIYNNNITIDNSVGFSTTNGKGILIYDLNGTQYFIENNTFRNFNGTDSNAHSALYLGGDIYNTITSDNCIVRNNKFINNMQSIYFLSDNTNRRFNLLNLTISDNFFNGSDNINEGHIELSEWAVTNLTIKNNSFNEIGSSSSNRGLRLYACDGVNKVEGNSFNGNAGGIIFYETADSTTGKIQFFNNIFYQNAESMRLFNLDEGTVEVFNNVFYNNVNGLDLESGSATTSDVIIQNNIFTNNTIGVVDGSSAANTILNYNLWYGNTANVSGTTIGANAVDGDPLFIQPNIKNFTVNISSPAIDAANSSFSVSYDKAGNSRVDALWIPNVGTGDFDYYDIGISEIQMAETVPPSINISSPLQKTTFTFGDVINVTLNVNSTDDNEVSGYWYNLDGGNNVTFRNGTVGLTFSSPSGSTVTHVIYVFVNDSFNNINSTSVLIYLDNGLSNTDQSSDSSSGGGSVNYPVTQEEIPETEEEVLGVDESEKGIEDSLGEELEEEIVEEQEKEPWYLKLYVVKLFRFILDWIILKL
ncbi:MAG: LamG-like jellyroll fold domain-containing protein [archaeon]